MPLLACSSDSRPRHGRLGRPAGTADPLRPAGAGCPSRLLTRDRLALVVPASPDGSRREPVALSSVASTWQDDLQVSARRLGAGMLAGFLSGALVGGLGGRLAMLALRLTSDPSLRGMETDDGFVIGEFTDGTGFLILFTAFLGVLGGMFYLAIRSWLPPRSRKVVMAVLGATVGGALVVHPDGIDFTLLEPLWLAVAMFVALPSLYGLALSALAERLLQQEGGAGRYLGWSAVLALLAPILAGPPGLIPVALLALGWVLNRRLPLTSVWSSEPAAWVGRAALLAVSVSALLALFGDVSNILVVERHRRPVVRK
jgi:hypothetical protein